jgi:hypothetical protein
MTEKLVLTKNGKLVETKWVYDKQKEEGSYVDSDVTDQAIRRIFDNCELEDGVTLKDVFLLLNTELQIFDAIIGNWCEKLVTEGLTKPAKPHTGQYDPEEIEYLELKKNYWQDKDSTYGQNRPDFGGTGYELKEDKLAGWNNKDGTPAVEMPKGERIPWGLSFTPTNELINLPLKLNRKLTIYNEDHESPDYHKVIAEYDNICYTLGDILYGILWELSFHGGPESRDGFKSTLDSQLEDYRKSLTDEV